MATFKITKNTTLLNFEGSDYHYVCGYSDFIEVVKEMKVSNEEYFNFVEKFDIIKEVKKIEKYQKVYDDSMKKLEKIAEKNKRRNIETYEYILEEYDEEDDEIIGIYNSAFIVK